jgi:hypothetical protein
MPGHRTPTPQSWRSMQYREAGFWAEHSRFFRNADTQNAQCASGAGCRSSQNGHKTRADEPVVLGARDKSALVRENCLPVIASAGTKADTFLSLPYRFNRQNSKLSLCQTTPYPTRQFARNNAPLNLPRSHEKPRRGTLRWSVNIFDNIYSPFYSQLGMAWA